MPAAEGWDGVVDEPGSGVHCAPHQGTAGFPSGTTDGPQGQINSEVFCFCTESEVLNTVFCGNYRKLCFFRNCLLRCKHRKCRKATSTQWPQSSQGCPVLVTFKEPAAITVS